MRSEVRRLGGVRFRSMRRRQLAAALAALCGLGSLTGCSGLISAKREFSLAADWKDYQRIVVNTRNGRVDVAPGGGSRIEISGTKRCRGTTLQEAEANVDRIQVVAEPDAHDPTAFAVSVIVPDELNRQSPGADVIVRVPARCAAQLRTSNGAIKVRELANTELDTSNGAIEATDIDGALTAETSNGAITIRGVRDGVQARSSNGRISVDKVGGRCALRTSNGAIVVMGVSAGLVAETSNGSIDARMTQASGGGDEVRLNTSNGGVSLTLPATMSANLDLSTSNAGISTDFGAAKAEVRERRKHSLAAALNGGGTNVRATTSNGGIVVKCR